MIIKISETNRTQEQYKAEFVGYAFQFYLKNNVLFRNCKSRARATLGVSLGHLNRGCVHVNAGVAE